MKATSRQRCTLEVRRRDGRNVIQRVHKSEWVCHACGAAVWRGADEGEEARAHVCDEARVQAREFAADVVRRLIALRDRIEVARDLTQYCLRVVRAEHAIV